MRKATAEGSECSDPSGSSYMQYPPEPAEGLVWASGVNTSNGKKAVGILKTIAGAVVLVFAFLGVLSTVSGPKEVFVPGHREITASEGTTFKESHIAGRGTFALRPFKKGELVERCPILRTDASALPPPLDDYWFTGPEGTDAFIPLGLCGLYNHGGAQDANCDHFSDEADPDVLLLYANRDIEEGEELLLDYGDEFWDSRLEDHETHHEEDPSEWEEDEHPVNHAAEGEGHKGIH
uniref:SET domain-containing protein n=1 Tax=Chromera velia CCMP2878 TaxID=1169474 RepID=A0A0G4FN53_9ALVE|eukprot:Cvel_17908.t1-p1 / transcript=Cvel_17908.t1 / gene=Cvel_17908 / organism=Chromera_velia_CCMP2878 / gene_product=hypothetical protein / transcript_product=hypothetical protein / location=Cvel_scaffold1455:534-3787(+) / protein_length=235 / sequence_SO=supercontig / SO=protein_coding / is_pseudo=false